MKTITIFMLFLFFAEISFAGAPLKGIDVKLGKNPGGGCAARMNTNNDGSFSLQVPEGSYTLSVDMLQIKKAVSEIVKRKDAGSTYEFDGTGVQIDLNNSSQIIVPNARKSGSIIAVDYGEVTIVVPKGGATISGKLNWNDAVINTSTKFSLPANKGAPSPEDVAVAGPGKSTGSIAVSLNINGGNSSSPGVSKLYKINTNAGIEWLWKGIGIGADAGFFITDPNFNFDNYVGPFKDKGIATITNTQSNWSSIYILAGPQYTFTLVKRIELAFSVKGGVTFNKGPNFIATEIEAPQTVIASYKDPEDMTRNAFTVKPGIIFNYSLNQHWGFNINAQYLLQTGQSEFATGYRNLSKVDFTAQSDEISKEILASPKVITDTKGPDKFLSFGFGVNYFFRATRVKSHSNTARYRPGNNKTAKINRTQNPDSTKVESLVGAAKVRSHSNTNNNRTQNPDSTKVEPLVAAAKVRSHSNTNNNRTQNPDSTKVEPLVGAAKVRSHSNTNNNRTQNTDSTKVEPLVAAAKVRSHSNTNNNRTQNPDSTKVEPLVGAAKVRSHSNTNNNRTQNPDSTVVQPLVGAAKVRSHSNINNNRTQNPDSTKVIDEKPPVRKGQINGSVVITQGGRAAQSDGNDDGNPFPPEGIKLETLTDLNRPLNADDKISVVTNFKITLAADNAAIAKSIRDKISVIYKIKQNSKGELFAVPEPFFGVVVPWKNVPDDNILGCTIPCATTEGTGKCGGFCFRTIHCDVAVSPMRKAAQPQSGQTTYKSVNGTIIFYENIGTGNSNVFVRSAGGAGPSQPLPTDSWCSCYISGYGTAAFQNTGGAACPEGVAFLNNVYSSMK